MDDLAIVIVTWNSAAFIERCLRSVESARGGLRVRVYVVDNGSVDGTGEIVRSRFPGVRYHENSVNLGFAAANNVALREARARYLMLLNPDTIAGSGSFASLARWMDSRPSCWAAGPAMLNEDGTPQRTGVRFPRTWNILSEALWLDRLFPRSKLFGSHRALFGDPSVAAQVDYVQGACLMVRSDELEKAGPLDEGFFMYFEETDLCFRLKRAGGEVWYVPEASVVHLGGGEFGHYDEERIVHYHSSLLRFYSKHYGRRRALLLRPVVLFRSFVRTLAWAAVYLFRPSVRTQACSSLRGYLRTLGVFFRAAPTP
jgi:GT2 family glycosyltransferase